MTDRASEDYVEEKEAKIPHGVDTESQVSGIAENSAFAKQTIRKIDIRLLVILGALYSLSLIDRTNLSAARIAGMGRELQLTVGERYSIVTLIFFVPYIIFELPSNLLLRKIGARNLLSFIAIAWGAVTIGIGFVKDWKALLACRFILGFLESGFFPGCVFLIQTWYTRFETQRRLAIFYLISVIASGLSAILAYGLAQLSGTGGYLGWSWIFIIEGIFTCALGVLAIFLIVDFPDKNKFLTEEQTQFVINRVNADRGDAVADKFTFKILLKHLRDPKIWGFGLLMMGSTTPAYAFAYFLPVILQGSGYSTVLVFCLNAPPNIAAAIWTYIVASLADRTRRRAPFIVLNSLICITGLMIVGYAEDKNFRFFGCFLAVMGAQANVPASVTYSANNVTSHSKRAVTTAVVIGMGGVGGIYASTVFRQKDAPSYIPGLWATFATQVTMILVAGLLSWYFKRSNEAADRGEKVIENQPNFRYTI